jgi:hypothetical protein
LIHCKNFCKCHNVPLLSTTIKRKTSKNQTKTKRTGVWLKYKALSSIHSTTKKKKRRKSIANIIPEAHLVLSPSVCPFPEVNAVLT